MCVYLLIPSTFKVAHEFGNHVLRIKLHTENTIYWDGGQKKVTAWKEQHLGNAASTSEAIRHARRHDINILDKKVQGFQEDPKPSCQIEDLYSKVDHVLLGMVSPLPLISAFLSRSHSPSDSQTINGDSRARYRKCWRTGTPAHEYLFAFDGWDPISVEAIHWLPELQSPQVVQM